MSAIYINNRLVHYEVVGRRGPPVLFLHSWLGSWRYWLPTMDHISEKHRAYALDFWGFGESDRRDGELTVDAYVDLVLGFIDQLGITRISVVGHGLGGVVALRAATVRPERFSRAMVVTTPLAGLPAQYSTRAKPLLRLFGRAQPNETWTRLVRQMTGDYPQILEEIVEDTESIDPTTIDHVIESIGKADLRATLQQLQVPVLAVFGGRDALVSADQRQYLLEDRDVLQQAVNFPKSQHFPFLDQPMAFNRMLMDFQESQGTPVEIKTEWRRRVSQLEYI